MVDAEKPGVYSRDEGKYTFAVTETHISNTTQHLLKLTSTRRQRFAEPLVSSRLASVERRLLANFLRHAWTSTSLFSFCRSYLNLVVSSDIHVRCRPQLPVIHYDQKFSLTSSQYILLHSSF